MSAETLAWLAARDRDVPPALGACVRDAVPRDGAGVTEALLHGAETVLRRVIDDAPMTRAHAVDVLSADALVTYAFEAAADHPETITVHAGTAMRRIAALAAGRENGS